MLFHQQNQYVLKLIVFFLLNSLAVVAVAQNQTDPVSGAVPQSEATLANGNQGFALFETIETSESRNGAINRPTRESRVTTSQPEFTLLGVSRIGGKYSAMLRHKDGDSLIVDADPGANTLIPEHTGYSIINISAASVSIRYPGSNACVEFNELGVSCNSAANIAELRLANGEPIASNATSSHRTVAAPQAELGGEIIEGQNAPRNPFAALNNTTRNGEATEAGATSNAEGRFTPRRISPEDVPEGMRVVATPFGDRLVEQ